MEPLIDNSVEWRKIDIKSVNYLTQDDDVYYLKLLDRSEAQNYKKDKWGKREHALKEFDYREKKIREFAYSIDYFLINYITKNDDDFIIIPIPGSQPTVKEKVHVAARRSPGSVPNKNNRHIETLEVLSDEYWNYKWFELLKTKERGSLTFKQIERDPDVIIEFLQLIDFPLSTQTIFLIDDVMTTGSTFKASKKKLLEKYPRLNVKGLIFWWNK